MHESATNRIVIIRALGGFSIEACGEVLLDEDWRPRKAASIVKILALQPKREITRDRLIDLLWPEASAEQGVNALYKHVHALRRTLGERTLVHVRGGMVSLDEHATTDVSSFIASCAAAAGQRDSLEAHEQAAALYGGDLLPRDLHAEWTLAVRELLRERYRELQCARSRLLISLERAEEAIAILEEICLDDPLDEALHRHLMRAYEAAGKRSHAVRAYERLRVALAAELGVEPSVETEHILQELRTSTRVSIAVASPDVRQARTPDGMRIAYSVTGSGSPLVHLSNVPFNHLDAEMKIPNWAAWHRRLGDGRTYVRYDGRGRGQSTREGATLRLETELMDLEAVLDEARLDNIDIVSSLHSSVTAIAFAARFPRRIGKLVMLHPYASAGHCINTALASAGRAMIERDWASYCELAATSTVGWRHHETAEAMAKMLGDAAAPSFAATLFSESWLTTDVTELLPFVRTPVLALYRPGIEVVPPEAVERVVSGIRHMTFRELETNVMLPIVGDTDTPMREILSFLGDET